MKAEGKAGGDVEGAEGQPRSGKRNPRGPRQREQGAREQSIEGQRKPRGANRESRSCGERGSTRRPDERGAGAAEGAKAGERGGPEGYRAKQKGLKLPELRLYLAGAIIIDVTNQFFTVYEILDIQHRYSFKQNCLFFPSSIYHQSTRVGIFTMVNRPPGT